ncbi:3-phosphoshikimate 1-carboxyvinyltransferase [Alteromonas sp. 1_MG-2023]|uniref:3-phosphoshikimate 1-carboxyvinyltransferase n=1 Tax=Alteromonas sp. 1_MG-2023 TaxID=3062669 RepID=UPI0026E39799|nr:3-phosphoshikimate 1-carboxyvinyltransferase [Alteromonas sp. 1_MG-2023]MDO6567488.1 3-phosphoshikimate 1-carboxyvinyltransferase [Alteromonas sp. 1_MG-2023]
MVLKVNHPIQEEPNIKHMLERMPKHVVNSFSEEQLTHINKALAGRRWGKHKLDLRGTLGIGRSRFYFVLLGGKDKRDPSRIESKIGQLTLAAGFTFFIIFSLAVGMVLLYILKSWLGINLFEDFSLGLWDWLKSIL